MITIYTTPSCSSCRKAKKWLDEHRVSYNEKNLFNEKITTNDVMAMLEHAENGFADIISTRSKIVREGNINVNEMTTKELTSFILENPSVLKRPIIIDGEKMQVGYNDEEIRIFIPKRLRDMIMYSRYNHTKDEYKKLLDLYFAELDAEKEGKPFHKIRNK